MEKPNTGLPKIGYLYHYPDLEHPEDAFRLDIYISPIPTEKHFDVQHATFITRSDHGAAQTMTVSHPWGFENQAPICPGPVIMTDRYGKKAEAFTFGGDLEIERMDQHTICTLVSSAPILDLTEAAPLNLLFADEVEILLAKYRAAVSSESKFDELVCQAGSFSFYLACLKEIISKLEHFPHRDDITQRLLVELHSQYHRLETAGLIKGEPTSLDKIFQMP